METLSKLIARTGASRVRKSLWQGVGLLRQHLWVWPLLAAAMMAIAGLMIRHSVETAAQAEMKAGLLALLKSNVEALKIWSETEQGMAVAVANEPDVRKAASELSRLASGNAADFNALTQSAAQEELRAALRPVLSRKHFAGYVLVNKDVVVLSADRQELIGQQRTTNYDLMSRTLERGSIVTPPFPTALLMRDSDGQMRAGQPTMFALAVVRDLTGDVVGAIGLRIKPNEDFVRILQIAQPGETGETYAFDSKGLLLSESRFTKDLIRLGLISDQGAGRSQLAVELRDPGVDLTKGRHPAKSRSEQPLTLMAASATRGESGVNVEGYRNYRGEPVVGAWTWLKDHDLGIATEKHFSEAYGSLYILRRAFWGMFGLLAASSAVILLFTLTTARLHKAAQHAVLQAKELGQYQLEEKLGEGGMGVVYRGRHRMLRRPTAIKLLHPDKTTDDAIARFEREVQLTCQLNHPNTIAIYDYGRTPEGIFYYAMEFLSGINLDTLVVRYGPQPESRVIYILRQVCGSLAEAHEIMLVHRDIKPANIVLSCRGGESDVAKVLDFGLVKAIDQKKESSLTSAGAVIGTPLYMSPEAVESPERVDGRSDVYSLAAVGYFLLTGTPPFEGKSVIEICMHHSRTPPQKPSERLRRPISADLEAVLLKGLAKNRHDRYHTAREFADALAACASAADWNSRKADLWWQSITVGVKSAVSSGTTGINEAQTVVLAALSGDGTM